MSEDVQAFQALMKRVREGSREAVALLLETYGQHILRVVRRKLSQKLRTVYDSRDFTQDTWTEFFAYQIQERDFERPQDLLTFLAAVARNKVIDAYRKRVGLNPDDVKAREKSLDGSAALAAGGVADSNPTPSQVAMANEKWDNLKKRVEGPARRILELLRQGLTHREIADKLDVSEKTVRRIVGRLGRSHPPE